MNTSRVPSKRSKAKPAARPLGLVSDLLTLNRQRIPDQALVEDVLKLLQGTFKFDAATLSLVDRINSRLEPVASVGRPAEVLDFVEVGQGHGLSAWSTASGNIVFLRDRSRSRMFDPQRDFGTFLSLPIPVSDTPIGALTLGFNAPNALTDEALETLKQIGDLLAFLMERYSYRQQLAHAQAKVHAMQNRPDKAPTLPDNNDKIASMVELAMGLNHEINDQLAVVVGNLQCLLVDDSVRNQKFLYRLRRMQEAALRIREAGAQLREFDQFHSGDYEGSDKTLAGSVESR
ncbi:MAG: GAF domain-containing protein [Candidatus Zixiibacteriota bacterium]